MQVFTSCSSKIEIFETFFYIVVTQNDHPRYVKHVLGHVLVFFILLGYWAPGGGGSPKGLVHNLLMRFFTSGAQKSKFSKLSFFNTVITQNDH